jgi:chromosome partitioning protein
MGQAQVLFIKSLINVSIISIVNQKGGCGKSTTAVHLAYWLSQNHSVAFIDADSQQSSSGWLSQLESSHFPCQAILDPEILFDAIEAAQEQSDLVIVDGPGSLSEVTKTILDLSDLTLVPCQPSGLDLSSSNQILQVIRQRQKVRGGHPLVGLFLSRAVKGTVLLREAQQALDADQRFPLLKAIIYQRQCISDAPIQNATVFNLSTSSAKAAASDYVALFQEALKTLG